MTRHVFFYSFVVLLSATFPSASALGYGLPPLRDFVLRWWSMLTLVLPF